MSEVLENKEIETEQIEANNIINSAWDNPGAVVEVQKQVQHEQPKAEEVKVEEKPVFEGSTWLKENFNFETIEDAKSAFEEYKSLKESSKQISFTNDQSKNLFEAILAGKKDEVYNFLHKEKELESIKNSSLDKVEDALNLLKVNLKYNNPNYTAQDIDDVIEEKYSFPPKPIQQLEDDDEYSSKLQEWQNRVDKINRAIMRDGRSAKDEITSKNESLVLPEIAYTSPKIEEERQRVEAYNNQLRELFENTVKNDFKNFNGFNTAYKSEDGVIDISVPYVVTETERESYKNGIIDLMPDNYFGERWFNQDGKPRVEQMLSDKYLLENRDKIFQSMIAKAVNLTRDAIISSTKNISFNGKASDGNFNPSVSEDFKKIQQAAWQ